MVVDSLLVPQCVYRPGTFTGLMTLYESNYIKLHQLASALEWPADAIVSSSPRDNDLHAEIVRREPYTTTLRLTYWFDDAGVSRRRTPTSSCASTTMRGSSKPSAAARRIGTRSSASWPRAATTSSIAAGGSICC